MIRKLANNKMLGFIPIRSRMNAITPCIKAGVPKEMRPALEYLVLGRSDSKTAAVVKRAEGRRREIASMGDKEISIWGSPKPKISGHDSSIDARPQPGKVIKFIMSRIAVTGKLEKWGTVLYLIARGFKSSIVIELGTCAGISAIYLASAPNVRNLVTVEGSEELADIARESLKMYTNTKIMNALFDEAFDSRFSSLESKVDLAFVDGHHEKTATIHYFNRLVPFMNPRAVIVFDDISWSYDMRETWNILSKRPEFAHAIDLGEIGVCVMKAEGESVKEAPEYWDLQPIVGKCKVSKGPDFWDWD